VVKSVPVIFLFFFSFLLFAKKPNKKNFQLEIDECAEKKDNCHDQATCTNTIGSFTCACNSGYTGNGVNCDGNFFFVIYYLLMI